MPLSAVGRGIPSAATPTVVAREGAVAAQTIATGPALVQGMAGVVYEQQTVTAMATNGGFSLRLTEDGDLSASILADVVGNNVSTDAEFKAAIESIVGEVSAAHEMTFSLRCSGVDGSTMFFQYMCHSWLYICARKSCSVAPAYGALRVQR